MDNKELKELEVRNVVKNFHAWDELKAAIENKDDEQIKAFVKELVQSLEKYNFNYVKRTFEIREDVLERMRIYCVRNDIKQKSFINIAIETLLSL